MFADSELTSFDALPAVWGQRSPWTDSLVSVRDRITTQTVISLALTGFESHQAIK